MKKLSLLLMCSMLITFNSVNVFADTGKNVYHDNLYGNILNGGFACENGNTIYFANENTGNQCFDMNNELFIDENVYCLNAIDDCIYYLTNNNYGIYLKKKNVNTNEISILLEWTKDNYIGNLIVKSNKCYYLINNVLQSLDLESGEIESLSDNQTENFLLLDEENLICLKNSVSDDDQKIELNTELYYHANNEEVLISKNVNSYDYGYEKIYFSQNGLYSYDLTDNKTEKIFDGNCDNIIFYNNYVYFIDRTNMQHSIKIYDTVTKNIINTAYKNVNRFNVTSLGLCVNIANDKEDLTIANGEVSLFSENSPLTTGISLFTNTESALFPMQYLNISQGVNGSFSHTGTNAIDITGKDSGIDPAYAPFSGTIKRKYNGYVVWLQSNNMVKYADGTIDYMTVMLMHDNDTTGVNVGTTFSQGQHFFDEGTTGYATGNHIHLECGKGAYYSNGWYQNSAGQWMIYNSKVPYDCLFLKSSTIVYNGYGYNWRTYNEHTHSYSTIASGHPHYSTCSCGANNGATNKVATCSQCYPLGSTSISLAKNSYLSSENITISGFGATNANQYQIVVKDADSEQTAINETISATAYTAKLSEGNYTVTVTAKNTNTGQIASSSRGFSVTDDYLPVATAIYDDKIYSLYDNAMSWEEAKTLCEAMGGHLATVTSEEEHNHIKELAKSGSMSGYYLGGNDVATEGTWQWITGETWNYECWNSGEPNNSGTGEDYLELAGEWNDVPNQYYKYIGFIAEFEPSYTPSATAEYGDSTYALYDTSMPWKEAKKFCESIGGHLAVITSVEEKASLDAILNSGNNERYWIGGTKESGEWQWITDEPCSINSDFWASGQPNDPNGTEKYLMSYNTGLWHDIANANTGYVVGTGIICEFESCVVYFNSMGGSDIASIKSSAGAKVSQPTAPTRKGYTFEGWYKDSDYQNLWDFENDTVNGTVNLYAKWTEIPIMLGDIYMDEKVNTKDYIKLLQYIAGIEVSMTEKELLAADVYPDGKINTKDYILLLQFIAGMNVTLGSK